MRPATNRPAVPRITDATSHDLAVAEIDRMIARRRGSTIDDYDADEEDYLDALIEATWNYEKAVMAAWVV
jgi:hypothetical protein